MKDIAISVDNISKCYSIGDTSSGSLRESIASLVSKRSSKNIEDFWALKDISFQVERGEAIGVIGKNGAGKSTLLKILSRITEPTTGRIVIDGRVSSLLEVGTGFHPELTGRENVFLNGTVLGMSRNEVKSKFDEIVEFSGVEKFLDTPVKRYSSGMKVRLAFAVAAHLEPEILIIDEVLAVGDAEFQKKCLGKMQTVAGQGRTILFVSHNMGAVQRLCNRAIVLQNGAMALSGTTEECVNFYLEENNTDEHVGSFTFSHELFDINQVRITQQSMAINELVDYDKDLMIEVDYTIKRDVSPFRIKLQLIQNQEIVFLIDDTFKNIEHEARKEGRYRCVFAIPKHLLNMIGYTLQIGVDMPGQSVLLDYTTVASFHVEDATGYFKYNRNWPGFLRPSLDISTENI